MVFDGAEKLHGAAAGAARGAGAVQQKGETADELIRQLVRAEPAGPAGRGDLLRPGGGRRRAPPRRLPAQSADTLLRRIARA